MSTQKALWLPEVGEEFTLGTTDIPEPGPGEVLVKLEASALNPLDWKIQKHGFFMVKEFPVVIGEEGAGIVTKVGEGVTNFTQGDRIFFQASFGTKYATFKEYTLVDAEVAAKVPDILSFDQAASIAVGIMPFAVAFYAQQPQGFAFTAPFQSEGGLGKYSDHPIVIMGGTSSLGQYAIQLAKLSGFSPIITTASLRNKDLLLSLGATHVIDRNISSAALRDEIAKITTTPVKYAFDAVAFEDTQQAAYDLLAPGGKVAIVTHQQIKEVEGRGKQVLMVFGSFQPPPNRQLGARFMRELTNWLAEGKIKPNIVEVLPGGLNGVVAGLKRLENNAVSGKKLIIHPAETA